jgi:hypothetical protein
MPFEILQVTAQYSNAVLVAIMPYVSDFAQRLDLPIPQPVTMSQVQRFSCYARSDQIGGRVFLTNGCAFSFTKGTVLHYCSPRSFYSLQDPDRVPEFYAPAKLTEKQTVEIARQAVKKLGYDDATFSSDRAPKVSRPSPIAKNRVARCLVEWLDPNQDPRAPMSRSTLKVEVNTSTGAIEMLSLLTPAAWRPDVQVAVHPPVIAGPPQAQPYGGGTRVYPVSPAYARAFLAAILPQVSDYAKKAGLEVKVPITRQDVDLPHYECGLVTGLPYACLFLKTGDRFWVEHGQVTDFQAHDSYRLLPSNSPPQDKPPEKFYGPVKVSAEQALAVVRKAITQLGYPAQVPLLRTRPEIVPPAKHGTNYFARYFFNWWRESPDLATAGAEVDASTGKLESLYINERLLPQLWREPPKIDVPPGAAAPAPEPQPPPAPAPRFPAPSSRTPPGTP